MKNPFRYYFDSSPEVIRLVVMIHVKYPLSLRNVEDLLAAFSIATDMPARAGFLAISSRICCSPQAMARLYDPVLPLALSGRVAASNPAPA
jgi:hypothetical protein